jgi:hypothetical protein
MKKIFLFITFLIPLHVLTAQSVLPGYNGFWNRNRKITVLDILDSYPDRLPYLRNEIYARYGRAFVTKAYQNYFDLQSWYRVRGNYTDNWLSETDRYNAELIRAIEEAPSATDTFAILRRNSEYQSSDRLFIFTSSEVLEEDKDSSDIYGRNVYPPRFYIAVGDWVVIHEVDSGASASGTYRVKACRLNHDRKTVTTTAEGYVSGAVFLPLIQAQSRLRSGQR